MTALLILFALLAGLGFVGSAWLHVWLATGRGGNPQIGMVLLLGGLACALLVALLSFGQKPRKGLFTQIREGGGLLAVAVTGGLLAYAMANGLYDDFFHGDVGDPFLGRLYSSVAMALFGVAWASLLSTLMRR